VTTDASAERPLYVGSQPSTPRKQRRPGPAEPHYGIHPEKWHDVLRRVEQGDSLRQIAQDYGVSYETVRRTVKVARRKEGI
jgi:DNA-binding NarL/FixJ family response regulator